MLGSKLAQEHSKVPVQVHSRFEELGLGSRSVRVQEHSKVGELVQEHSKVGELVQEHSRVEELGLGSRWVRVQEHNKVEVRVHSKVGVQEHSMAQVLGSSCWPCGP